MSDSNKSGSSGLGLCSVVGVVFVILKLTKLIDWSWFWVLFPFMLGIGIWLLVIIIAFIVMAVQEISWRRHFRK